MGPPSIEIEIEHARPYFTLVFAGQLTCFCISELGFVYSTKKKKEQDNNIVNELVTLSDQIQRLIFMSICS